tara:strand:+ start:1144 stop:2019 length:876 start_codon:yes stop_codon:yes gene_type:complete
LSKKKKRKNSRLKKVLLTILILLPITLILLLSIPIATTFNVSVQTELITVEITDALNSKIPLQNAIIYNREGDSIGLFDGDFKSSVGAEVNIERIANGPLSIQIEGKNNESAGSFYSKFTDFKTGDAQNFIEFVVTDIGEKADSGITQVIPINGKVDLGRNILFESFSNSSAILRHGEVVVIGKSLLTNTYYKSTTYQLNTGDEFRIINPVSKSYGFVIINENPGMSAAYKVIGDEGRILTPGPRDDSSGYPVKLSLLSKLENDIFFKALSIFIALLITVATIYPFFSMYY